MTNAIRVLEPDGTERQIIPDKDGNMPRAKIRAASVADPFVLVVREDDSIGLFVGETEKGKIRRKDMSPMGDKVRAGLVFFLLLLWEEHELIFYFIFGGIFIDVEVPHRMFLLRYDGVV
jgi:hypothetical protein